MNNKSLWKLTTNIEITAYNLGGKIIDVVRIKNEIHNLGLTIARNLLAGDKKIGVADATEANKLHDADGGFSALDVGKLLFNSTDTTCTIISGFVDSGELDLTDDIMADTEDYTIYPVGDGITQLGVGTSNAVINVADTTMGNETFRKAMTTQTTSGVGGLVSSVYISPTEAVFAIKELAWFWGVTALATPNYDTGIMVARVLYTRNKTNIESLQVKRTDTFSEA